MLFERDAYLAALESRLDALGEGRGHVAFIVGEAGIGKTSLMRELAARARPRVRVLQAACEDFSTPEALVVLHDLGLGTGSGSRACSRWVGSSTSVTSCVPRICTTRRNRRSTASRHP